MSSLETSVSLEDVFTVVEAKRVPLAPELAGYLTLEIADGTDAGSGDVDPKTVFISEEGTVALVRPKKDVTTGDAEASVRKLLTKLLEASGSGTPALGAAAKRKPGNGLPALVEELEAALIPVNRSAGRRALARLAREVKRVLLGVGRNANVAPVANRPAGPHARPPIRKRDDDGAPKPTKSSPAMQRPRVNPFEAEAATAKRESIAADLAASEADAEAKPADAEAKLPEPSPRAPAVGASPFGVDSLDEILDRPKERAMPKIAPPGESARPPFGAPLLSPPAPPVLSPPAALAGPVAAGPVAAPLPRTAGPKDLTPPPPPPPVMKALTPPPPPMVAPEPSPPKPPDARPKPRIFGGDEVDSLLDSFAVSGSGDKQMSRDLKAIAGLSPTPPPPDARTLAELTKDVGKPLPRRMETPMDTDGVEALLALADASVPLGARSDDEAATPLRPAMDLPSGMPALPKAEDDRAAGDRNLPPSPLFGVPAAPRAPLGSLPGAPAALRKAEASGPQLHAEEPARPKAAPQPAPPPKVKVELPGASASEASKKKAPRKRAPKTGFGLVVFALLVLAGGTVAIWKFAPQVFTGRRTFTPVPPVSTTPPVALAPKCKVALVLTEIPANAEILLRMGQAPVDVERMPVGTRLELVATAEGHAPRRAIIKAESQWDKGPDGKPRIEVPIQLDPSKAKPGAVDPWPLAEPGSQVGGSGPPGMVHVVSNVRGAEVWLLAGLGPEARIDQLRCEGDIDVLLAGPPALRKRLHIPEKDIAAAVADPQGNKIVNVSGK